VIQSALQPLVIVRQDRPYLCERFSDVLSELARVVLDRRGGERRQDHAPMEADRRRAERRHLLTHRAREQFRTLAYLFVYPTQEFQKSQLDDFAPAFCPACERVLGFKMPRFVLPPSHVDIEVRHILSGSGTKHLVDLEASMASGRTLLNCQITARDFW